MVKSTRKKSRRKAVRKCKYGALKSPIKTPSGAMRYCKKAPKKSRRKSVRRKSVRRKSVRRKSVRKKSRRKAVRKCKYGALKTPVKTPSGAMRYCKKAPKKSRRKSVRRKSVRRKSVRRKSVRRKSVRKKSRNCKYGPLTQRVKTAGGGWRYCKKAPKKSRRKKSRRK